jgi:hypothetical protein
MNTDHLKSLLAAGSADEPTKSPSCPDEHEIAGYVDGALGDAAREQVELHVADCRRCLALVGLLCRERDTDAVQPMPDGAMAPTRARVTKRPRPRWRLAPQWAAAAAAALVLAVPLLFQTGRNPDRGVEGQGRPEPSVTRSLAPTANGLQVLSPGDGASVDPRRLSFRWTEVFGSPYYDVRILTDAGDVVIRQRVTGTTWRPPAQLNLQPGAEYFVHIDAYPSGDKAVSSDHVPFRLSD